MTAPPATPGAVPAVASPGPERPRRQLSCLGKGIISCIDGGCFGAAIGAIFSSARAMSSLAAGTESVVGALGMVARSGLQSGLSLGAALGFYSGGVCSLEQFRSKRDLVNPFLVGGIMGAFGAVQRVEVHDGQRKMRVLAYSPRGMAVGALTSGMLCSLFWYIQQPTRREAASPSAGEGVSPPSPQRQTQRPPAPLSTPSLPPAPRGEDWRSRAEVADPYAASQGASSAELLLTDGQTLDGSGGGGGATTTVAGAGEMMQPPSAPQQLGGSGGELLPSHADGQMLGAGVGVSGMGDPPSLMPPPAAGEPDAAHQEFKDPWAGRDDSK